MSRCGSNEIHAVLLRNLKGRPPVSDVFGKALEPVLPALGPAGEALSIGREARLDHLAGRSIEHRGLEDVLVDVDRRVQHLRPPLVDRGRIVRSGQDGAVWHPP